MSDSEAKKGGATGISLSDLYQSKVQEGRAAFGEAAGMQLEILKAVKNAVDDINANDPFISIKIARQNPPSGGTALLYLFVQEDGQDTLRLRLSTRPAAAALSKADIAFFTSQTPSDKDVPVFVIGEDALKNTDGVADALKQGLSSALASRALEKAPKNLPDSKINTVFDLK